MAGAAAATAALETYIRASVQFVAEHRRQMKALLEIFMNGGVRYEPGTELVVLSPVEEILLAGQEAGEFRDFDRRVMATVIRRAIDGLPFLLETHADIDLGAYADELATTFALATRAPAPQAASGPEAAPVPSTDPADGGGSHEQDRGSPCRRPANRLTRTRRAQPTRAN
ncbi:MAG TPA: hypothetical protein VF223_16230 [Trebonia sp.]